MSLFLRADLSQAEDRLVKVLSHDPQLIELARRKPWDFDVHKYNGAIIMGKPEEEITYAERQSSKRVVHGSNYDAQPERISEVLLDDGFYLPPAEVAVRQERYHSKHPGIRKGYQMRTRMLIIKERKLTCDQCGFSIEFKYERLEGSLFRRAYAWRPQHIIGYHLNQEGLIPLYEYIQDHDLRSRIAFQVHDEVTVDLADSREGYDILRFLSDKLEVERSYESERLVIPVEFALEYRYHGREGELVEYKKPPSEADFKAAWALLSSAQASASLSSQRQAEQG